MTGTPAARALQRSTLIDPPCLCRFLAAQGDLDINISYYKKVVRFFCLTIKISITTILVQLYIGPVMVSFSDLNFRMVLGYFLAPLNTKTLGARGAISNYIYIIPFSLFK